MSQKAILNILKKAPEATLAPLFDASLRVANDIRTDQELINNNGFSLITGYGLPEVALDALTAFGNEQNNRTQERKEACVQSAINESRDKRHRLIIPGAKLQLNLDDCNVEISWKCQKFPLDLLGCEIQFFVNGRHIHTEPLEPDFSSSILNAVSLPVELASRYIVELRLLRHSSGEDSIIGMREQEFFSNKPGCLEFIEFAGTFRLREKRDRINKPRTVAYILKPGYELRPESGMTLVESYASNDMPPIDVYEVLPSASASLVKNDESCDVVYSWKEDYVARIHRSRALGETETGIDVYGVVSNKWNGNNALPYVTLELTDGPRDLKELQFFCLTGDKRMPLRHKVRWQNDEKVEGVFSRAASIEITLEKTSGLAKFAPDCTLLIGRKTPITTNGDTIEPIFRYRFAVIPIQTFRPIEAKLEFGKIISTYAFETTEAVTVWKEGFPEQTIEAWGTYTSRQLLKDEFLNLKISPQDSSTEPMSIKLALAAIDISFPQALLDLEQKCHEQKRDICLIDIADLSRTNRYATLSSIGSRSNRAIYASFGNNPLLYRELHHATTITFDLFGDLGFLKQNSMRAERLSLNFLLRYGEERATVAGTDDKTKIPPRRQWVPSTLEFNAITCRKGFGPSSLSLTIDRYGSRHLNFEGVLQCPVKIECQLEKTGKSLYDDMISQESSQWMLPEEINRRVARGQKINLTLTPVIAPAMNLFGKPTPEPSYATTLLLEA